MSGWGLLGKPEGIEGWPREYVERWMKLSVKVANAQKMRPKQRELTMRDLEHERKSIISSASKEKSDGRDVELPVV